MHTPPAGLVFDNAQCEAYYHQVRAAAERDGVLPAFDKTMHYLAHWGDQRDTGPTTCRLWPDLIANEAPGDFSFEWLHGTTRIMNGGVIYRPDVKRWDVHT
jgi:hypothetical protein